MNLQLIGHHLDITPPIRDYVTTKLDRIVRHFDDAIDATVTLSIIKLQHKAEVTLRVRGKDLHTESTDADMYAAIDSMIDKLDRLVIKHKEMRISKRAQSESTGRMSASE
jgi:ribosomal subunit interface protein